MRRMHSSKACWVTVLALTTLSSLLAGYTYWEGWGSEGGAAHWERYLNGDVDAFAHKEKSPFRSRVYEADDNVDSHRYNLKSFLNRRKEKMATIKAKKRRKGKILEYKSTNVVSKKSCVPFRTLKNNTRICVHSKLRDQFISSHIRDTGSWEPDLLSAMATALADNPDMHLLDIGCNVGTFTFVAALMGRKVLAIDPLRSNLFMLHSSLYYAGIRDNVTLLLNAISDYAEPVRVLVNQENLGGSRIEPVSGHVSESDIVVDAVVMDDLVRVMDFKKVFVKIDIEGYEVNAFRHASKFLHTFDVRYIMMEWMFQRYSSHGSTIIEFLTKRGFRPFADVKHTAKLSLQDYYLWPDNMFWYKTNDRST